MGRPFEIIERRGREPFLNDKTLPYPFLTVTDLGEGPLPPCVAGEGVRRLKRQDRPFSDPCHLVWQVKQFPGYAFSQRTASPAGQAGRGLPEGVAGPRLADELLHLPHKVAGAPNNPSPESGTVSPFSLLAWTRAFNPLATPHSDGLDRCTAGCLVAQVDQGKRGCLRIRSTVALRDRWE
jgi:hypothetical protein